jgi:hypothetical protein
MQEVEESQRRVQEEIVGKENTGWSRDAGSGRKLKEQEEETHGKENAGKGQRCRELKNLKGECRKK